MARPPKWMTPRRRFFLNVEKRPGGCWVWIGKRVRCKPTNTQRYGFFKVGEKCHYAHRWSYEQFVGPLAPGEKVCHECDNGLCVKPEHLTAGTQSYNMKACAARGRHGKGNAKLNPEKVRIIRERFKAWSRTDGATALAREFGVEVSAIYLVVTRKRWADV